MRPSSSSLWPDYRTVWRWHFYAGLLCLPFIAFLALTGTVYLFKPQIDAVIDRSYDHLATTGPLAPPSAAVAAALHAVPDSRFMALELPRGPSHATRVILRKGEDAIRVYVDPHSLAVLKTVSEEWRFERIVFKLHGQLLMGNFGSIIMELVASWTIVLVATGLYLWWPRGQFRLAGVLYPRIGAGGRVVWRDLHAVAGVWSSLLITLFLVSGLPWSFVWGHALEQVEHRLGPIMSVQDWEIGKVPMRAVIAGKPDGVVGMANMTDASSAPSPHAAAPVATSSDEMADMPGMDMPMAAPVPATKPVVNLLALDRLSSLQQAQAMPDPVLITPPDAAGGPWRIRSDTQDRPRRESLLVSEDGTVLHHEGLADKGKVDQVIAYGVAAHEGQLFGWPNQLMNLLVASALLTMSMAAVVMWLRRRPPGRLGVPASLPEGRTGWGAWAFMLVLGMLLPELGASLLVLLVLAGMRRAA